MTLFSRHDGGYIVTHRGLEAQDVVRTRAQIHQQIECLADTHSREGILTDVLGVILVNFSQLVVALTQAKTFADINSAAQSIADIVAVVDTAVKSGELTLPYMVKSKGVSGVLSDISKLSNNVSAVLLRAQNQTN